MCEQRIAITIHRLPHDRLEIAHDVRAAFTPGERALHSFSQATKAAVALVGHARSPSYISPRFASQVNQSRRSRLRAIAIKKPPKYRSGESITRCSGIENARPTSGNLCTNAA